MLVNPLTKLWRSLDSKGLLRSRMSQYFKLDAIAVVSGIGFLEDGLDQE